MSFGFPIRVVIFVGLTAAAIFGSAGRLDLPFLWAFFAVVVAAWAVGLGTMDRGLLRERMHPGPGGLDRGLRLIIVPVFAGVLVVAGLDVGRYHWSQVPASGQALALAAVAVGYGLSLWAVHVNRFFSPVVRIQSERGHQLVTSGPYAWIRHPGYTGSLITMLASGPALGSWWALLPASVAAALMLRRVILEDRFLHTNLDGYRAYAGRVRYRLAPGVW